MSASFFTSSSLKSPQNQTGVTLIEMVVVIAVMAIASTSLLSVLAQTSRASVDPALKQQALIIAKAYLDEMNGYQYPVDATCPTPSPALSNHGDYTELCHFNLVDNDTPWDLGSGSVNTDLAGFKVGVDIESGGSVVLGDGTGNLTANTDVLLITVDVLTPDNQTLSLSRYRANW
jgi:MSHA pilin protein MshD